MSEFSMKSTSGIETNSGLVREGMASLGGPLVIISSSGIMVFARLKPLEKGFNTLALINSSDSLLLRSRNILGSVVPSS